MMQTPHRSPTTGPRHRRVSALVVLVLALSSVLLVVAPPQAALACTYDPGVAPAGTWVNIDAATRGETRIHVDPCTSYSSCSGGVCRTSYRSSIRVWGSCSPTDCDWGQRFLQSGSDGWQIATYAHGWKTATVWIRPYVYSGRDYVRVWVNHDYHDGRTDRVSDNWFVRG